MSCHSKAVLFRRLPLFRTIVMSESRAAVFFINQNTVRIKLSAFRVFPADFNFISLFLLSQDLPVLYFSWVIYFATCFPWNTNRWSFKVFRVFCTSVGQRENCNLVAFKSGRLEEYDLGAGNSNSVAGTILFVPLCHIFLWIMSLLCRGWIFFKWLCSKYSNLLYRHLVLMSSSTNWSYSSSITWQLYLSDEMWLLFCFSWILQMFKG